jgi:cell division protein FtsZ
VQQACSIIQGAAHDDANIIFGAVLDEKMKDAVKITVIATGFRETPAARPRYQENRNSFAAAHDDAMDFPEPIGPSEPGSIPLNEPAHLAHEGSALGSSEQPFVVPATAGAMAHISGEVVSLDSVRTAMVANFEQDDLDVPAFLRKRGDVM